MSPRYKRPPVVEVMCEFRFAPGDWDQTAIGLMFQKLPEEYKQKKQTIAVFEQSIAAAGTSVEVNRQERVRFVRSDEAAFLQIGAHNLAVSHSKPYPGWPVFGALIQTAFSAYHDVAEPTAVHRIGLRYLNEIHFEGQQVVEPADFLEFHPHIDREIFRNYNQFGLRAEFTYNDRDVLRAVLRAQPSSEDHAVFVLDLDYFLAKPEAVELADQAAWIETAHDTVVDFFESAIKDSLREKFN